MTFHQNTDRLSLSISLAFLAKNLWIWSLWLIRHRPTFGNSRVSSSEIHIYPILTLIFLIRIIYTFVYHVFMYYTVRALSVIIIDHKHTFLLMYWEYIFLTKSSYYNNEFLIRKNYVEYRCRYVITISVKLTIKPQSMWRWFTERWEKSRCV